MNNSNDLPEFLLDYGSLYSHLQGQMEGLNTVQIGDKFATLAEHLIPHTESGQDFERSTKSKRSWDKGVDISFKHRTEADIELRAQVKYTISSVDDIDLIISKFRDYENTTKNSKQGELNFNSEQKKPRNSKQLLDNNCIKNSKHNIKIRKNAKTIRRVLQAASLRQPLSVY